MGFLSNIVDGITGQGAADAAERSAELMAEAATDAIVRADAGLALQTQQNQPYMRAGAQALPLLQEATTTPAAHYEAFQEDPTGYTYLRNNPMFRESTRYAGNQLKNVASATGRFSSGGLVDELFRNYLATGDQMWGNYLQRGEALTSGNVGRLAMPVQIGMNASGRQQQNIAQNVVNTGNWRTGQGSALAAGEVGAANAWGQGAENLVNLGLLAFGAGAGGVGGAAAAGGGIGSIQDPMQYPNIWGV